MAGVIVAAAAAGFFLLNASNRDRPRPHPLLPAPAVAAPAPSASAPALTPLSTAAGTDVSISSRARPVVAAAAPASPAPARTAVTPAPATAPVQASTAMPSAATTRVAAAPATTQATVPVPVSAAAAFAQAKQRLAAGDPAGARRVLNAALIAGLFSDTEAIDAKRQMAGINKLLIFSTRRMPGDEWVVTHKVEPGELLAKIAASDNLNYQFVQRINNGLDDPRKLRAGSTIKLLKGPFHAVVTKHAFTMDLYLGAPGGEGSMYVTTYPVGLGTEDSTPTGKWLVEPGHKARNPKYIDPRSGRVFEPDDPENPLGEYWIGLLGTEGSSVGQISYGIHATIEPNTIGKQASMGCIRLLNDDVAQVFDMLVEGKSTVIVLP